MAVEWFYQVMGDVVGPVSAEELRQRVRSRHIERDTLIRKGIDGNWIMAEKVQGLFQAPGETEPPPIIRSSPVITQPDRTRVEATPPAASYWKVPKVWVIGVLGVVGFALLSGLLLLYRSPEKQFERFVRQVHRDMPQSLTCTYDESRPEIDFVCKGTTTVDVAVLDLRYNVEKTTSLTSPYSAELALDLRLIVKNMQVNRKPRNKTGTLRLICQYAYQDGAWVFTGFKGEPNANCDMDKESEESFAESLATILLGIGRCIFGEDPRFLDLLVRTPGISDGQYRTSRRDAMRQLVGFRLAIYPVEDRQ